MKTLEINEEESVAIHNAVIFMANDLMEEIVELEAWIKDYPESQYIEDQKKRLIEAKRRWDVMIGITKKVEA